MQIESPDIFKDDVLVQKPLGEGDGEKGNTKDCKVFGLQFYKIFRIRYHKKFGIMQIHNE